MVVRVQAHELGIRDRSGKAAPLLKGRPIVVATVQDEGWGGYLRQQIDDIDVSSRRSVPEQSFRPKSICV